MNGWGYAGMIISNQRLAAMQESRDGAFRRRMVARLRLKYPVESAKRSDAELGLFVDQAIARGEALRIHQKANLRTLAGFLFPRGLYCLERPEYRWALQILKGPKDENARMNLLREHLIFGRHSTSAGGAA